MIEVSLFLIFSAFLAGVLMFLAPCTLPLVPAYLAFISGVKRTDFTNNENQRSVRRHMIHNSLSFVFGFTVVFVLFGIAAGALGSQIGIYRNLLSQIGGVLVIVFGLFMINVLDIPFLAKERKFSLPTYIQPGHPVSAFAIGAIFALGWTPCVGPVLATVIFLATDSATVIEGGLLLLVFSLGLAIPFMLTALGFAHAQKVIAQYAFVTKWIQIVGGLFLILIGGLLVSSNFELTVVYGGHIFEFLRMDWLYDYL